MENALDRAGVARVFKEAMRRFIATRPPDVREYLLRSTSGTTGSGPLHVISKLTPEVYDHYLDQRLVVCMGALNTRLSNVRAVRYGRGNAQRIICIDADDIGANLARIIDDYAPDAVYGGVSFVVSFATRTHLEHANGVVKVSLTGEYLTEVAARVLQGVFPHARIVSAYGTSETSLAFKYPCTFLPRNAHHPFDAIDVEVLSPDEDGIGDIALSWDVVPGVRASRYRIGDTGKLSTAPCECGAPQTIYLLGRSGYDYIKLVGALLRKEEFDRVASVCGAYLDEYRAEAYTTFLRGAQKGGVILRVYRASGALTDEEKERLSRRFASELFVTPTRTYAQLVEQQVFEPLVVECALKPFERRGKEVKLRMRS